MVEDHKSAILGRLDLIGQFTIAERVDVADLFVEEFGGSARSDE